ncbi:MAG: FeoA family protein [Nannocystaceae bacterium]
MAPWYQVLENDFQLHGTIPATARTTVHRGLCDLEIGARARVHAVDSAAGLTVRLLEMGLVPGTEITLIKRAPFGDPLEFRIRGYHLSLRRSEARLVRIEPDR